MYSASDGPLGAEPVAPPVFKPKKGGGKKRASSPTKHTKLIKVGQQKPDEGVAALAAERLRKAAMEAALTHAPPVNVFDALKAKESEEAKPSPSQMLATELVQELQPSRLEPHFVVRKKERKAREKKSRMSPWKSLRRGKESIVPTTLVDPPLNPAFTKEVLLEKYAKLKEENGFDLVEKLKNSAFCDGFVRRLEPDKKMELLLQSDRYNVMAEIGRDMLEGEDAERFAHCFLPTKMVRESSIAVHGSLDATSVAASFFGILSCMQDDYRLDLSSSGVQAGGLGAWGDTLDQWASPTLTSLSLSDNKLGAEEGAKIYEVLLALENLTELDLSKNPLSIEKYEPNSGSRRYLSAFHETREEDAPKWKKGLLAENHTLTKLDLSSCDMRAEGAKELAMQLRKNTVLRELDISKNCLGEMNLPEGWRLTNFVKYKYRHDDGAQRQDHLPDGSRLTGCIAFGDFVTDNRTLTHLNISDNDICLVGMDGLATLCEGLKKNKHLTHVDISNNRLMELGSTILGKAMKVNATITNLVVSDVPLPIQDVKTEEMVHLYRDQSKEYLDAIVIKAMMEENIGLKSITFGHEHVQVTMTPSLKTVDFSERKLAPAMSIILAAFMPKARLLSSLTFLGAGDQVFNLNNRMTELDISGKMFMPTANLIAAYMPKMWALKRLTFGKPKHPCNMRTSMVEAMFGGRQMESVGAIIFSAFLPRCHDVLDLDLKDNCFYAEGTDRVAVALLNNKSVTRLDLSRNQMENEGAGHVALAIETNKSLTKINLSSNEIDDLGAQRLVNAMKENKTVKSLDVRGNALSDSGKDDLRRVALVHKVNLLY
jgi:Ran GTPase-activating protein (RanGAP) involved in mRNA processing and transport